MFDFRTSVNIYAIACKNLSEPCPKVGPISCYMELQLALENCISKLSYKDGNVRFLLRLIAAVLQNISAAATVLQYAYCRIS